MVKPSLSSSGRLLLGLLALVAVALPSPLLTSPSANDVSDLKNDRPHDLLLETSVPSYTKRSDDFDEQYYNERGGIESSSSSSEEDDEEYDGTGIYVGLNRAKQENDGEEGKVPEEQKSNWQACVKRGNAFMKLFSETEVPSAEQSKFFANDDLRKHGWTVKEKTLDPTIEDKCLIEPLDQLKVPYGPKPGAQTWQRLAFIHDQQTKGPLGEVYPATLGKSENIYNAEYGSIVGINLVAPAQGAEGKGLQPNEITPMRFASDILYLAWEHQCQRSKVSPSTLKHYLGANVVNRPTRDAVREVLGGFLVKRLPEWPGIDYTETKDEPAMAALLGTPVGSALSRMLIQRKDSMGRNRRIVSIKVWSEQPKDNEQFKNHGPLLYMLFELSDVALDNTGASGAGKSAQEAQEPSGPTMPQGPWSKPSLPIVGGQSDDVTVQPGIISGSTESDARTEMEDALQRSEAQAGAAGSRQNINQPSSSRGGSQPSRRSRHRRDRQISLNDHLQRDLDASRLKRQNEEAPHLSSKDDIGSKEAGRRIMPSNQKLRQRDRSLPEDGDSRLQNRDDGSDAVSSRTKPYEAPQANTVLHKLVRRMEPGPSNQPERFVPQPGERLPFVQSSASSLSQLTGYSFSAGPGPRPGQSFDSYVFKRAQEDGFYWIKRLGSDTLSPEDESQVPALYDQGDYGYELDESWQLPREPLGFKGLKDVVPGFYDPQGRPNQDWMPMRWVHENQWVDDEDFKHHPLSAGMFENVYSPKHRAILYWSHVEPSRYAKKPGQQEPQMNKEEATPANKPPPPESRAGMSSLTNDWEGFSIRQGEDGETDQKHDVNLHKHKGKQIAEEDMTPVRLPDTWMFDWVRVCKAAGHPVADLKHVIMPNVLETHTLEVLETLMEGRLEDWGPWPGQGFAIKHNEPILGTPLGVSVAKLIVQRHEMFGPERTLVGGNVWWTPPPAGSPEGTRGAVGLLLSLDDAPAELLQQQRAALPARDQAGSSQPGGTGKRPVTTPPKGQPDPKRPKPGVQ